MDRWLEFNAWIRRFHFHAEAYKSRHWYWHSGKSAKGRSWRARLGYLSLALYKTR